MKLLLLLFFFLSGACGLVYEVVWTKLFALSMGSTTYALSTVLAAFMGGLALGSWFGGKWIDRRGNPLLTYGILEGAIGLYCLIVPWLVGLIPIIMSPLYDKYYVDHLFLFGLLRFFISIVILLVPTVLMGASLPVLARYYASEKGRFGWEVGRLYAVNTLGAGVGCFSAGFFLLPLLGQRWSIYSAAFVNIGIFVVVALWWAAFERGKSIKAVAEGKPEIAPETAAQKEPEFKWGRAVLWAALAAYAANGFAGMAYQVAWTRALTLSIGSSAYSFTIIVTIFILGLAIGGGVGARLTDRLKNPAAAMGWVEILIGFSAIWAMWGLGRLPEWMMPVVDRFSREWSTLLTVEFVLVGLLLFFPTVLMGAVFPLAIKTVGIYREGIGEPVGLAYGINTGGAILGSLAAGFLLVPAVGLQNTIAVANIVNWVAGACLLGVVGAGGVVRRWTKAAIPVAIGILVTVSIPAWDTGIMSSGPYIYAVRSGKSKISDFPELHPKYMKFYKEGIDTTVTVVQFNPQYIFLKVNGKTDASTGLDDMLTQELSAHIPMLSHPDPKKVCIVGLASGVTLGSILTHPVERVDVLEISEAVVEASDYFKDWNHNALSDARVKLIIGDGRNHLLMTQKKYDVIISEPSNPWIAGISVLFTKEFFESVRDHLTPGGVFCCWVQGYDMFPDGLRMVMRAFQSVFPEAVLWETANTQDYMLVGSLGSLRLDPATLDARMRAEKVARDLERVRTTNVSELAAKFLMGSRRFRMAAGEGEYHIDDRLQLEYRAPRYLYKSRNLYLELYKKVVRYKEHPRVIFVPEEKWPVSAADAINREIAARDAYHNGRLEYARGNRATSQEYLLESIRLSPRNKWYQKAFKGEISYLGKKLIEEGKLDTALALYNEAVRLIPDDAELYNKLGSVYMYKEKIEKAREQFEKAVELDSWDFLAVYNLGYIHLITAEVTEAMEKFQRAVEIKVDYSMAYNGIGTIFVQQNRLSEAAEYFRKAIKYDPENADAYKNLGRIFIQDQQNRKKREKGYKYLKKALSLDPSMEQDEKLIELLKGKDK